MQRRRKQSKEPDSDASGAAPPAAPPPPPIIIQPIVEDSPSQPTKRNAVRRATKKKPATRGTKPTRRTKTDSTAKAAKAATAGKTAKPKRPVQATKASSKRTANKSAAKSGKSGQQPANGVTAIDAEEVDPLQHEDLTEVAIRSAPAWLISLVIHTAMFLILGLLYVVKIAPDVISLDVTYAEQIGVQLDDDTLQSNLLEATDLVDPVYSMDTNPADDPLAAPPDLQKHIEGMMATDTLQAPSVGMALTGREPGMKKALLAAYGGTATTEAAVDRALQWLKKNQRRDGLWSLVGPYSNGAFDENKVAATAMALLAFQGAGNTHQSGKYQQQVNKGWRALLKQQDRDGNFFQVGLRDQRLYSQAQVTIALCELYGMTKDSLFKRPAQKAIDYAVKIQSKEGGWRYQPGVESDTSVTGWFVMGLQSAMMAGLDVPSPTLQRIRDYLDSVAMYGGSFYKYQSIRKGFTPSMTAEGLLCRQYLGWRHDNPKLAEGVAFVLENPINWDEPNSYYWYYATQLCHHMEGDAWDQWNRGMRDSVPKHQVMTGKEKGSWPADNDRWGNYGGRLYMTCLCTYMLEVYYRHLPIYSYRMD